MAGSNDAARGADVSHLYKGVEISIERIGPEAAKEMLECNVDNRSPKKSALAKALEDGEWQLNGETIVFSDTGRLIDGQNRLIAVIKTGVPIDTIVIRGVRDDSQQTIDTGVKRTVADYLKMQGYKEYPRVAAMAVGLVKAREHGIERAVGKTGSGDVTVKGVLAYIDKYYDKRIKPILPRCRAVSQKFKGVPSSVIAVLADAFKRIDLESYEDFMAQLLDEREACRPVRLLRNRLEQNADSKTGKLPHRTVAALIIKAWNAYMDGEEPMRLVFAPGGAHPEPFPEISRGGR